MLTIRYEDGRVVIKTDEVVGLRIGPAGEIVIDAPNGASFEVGRTPGQSTESAMVSPTPGRVQVKGPPATLWQDSRRGESKPWHLPGLNAYEYLRYGLQNAGRPLSLDELTDWVLNESAYESISRNPRNTLRTALGRKGSIFEQVSRTHWGLVEWHSEPEGGAQDRD